MKNLVAALFCSLLIGAAGAQTTPVGLWKSIDDNTQKERSYVRITETAGVLSGRIERTLDPNAKPTDVCGMCTDERKDKPIVGLVIIRNARQDADDKSTWTGGDVTDPDNGKVYRLRLKPLEGGKKLEVRGYIGPFFRSQTWHRVE